MYLKNFIFECSIFFLHRNLTNREQMLSHVGKQVKNSPDVSAGNVTLVVWSSWVWAELTVCSCRMSSGSSLLNDVHKKWYENIRARAILVEILAWVNK